MRDRMCSSLPEYFCLDDGKCRVIYELGFPLTSDGFHLTSHGELYMVERLFDDKRFIKPWNTSLGVGWDDF
jgi:hypothetical protein